MRKNKNMEPLQRGDLCILSSWSMDDDDLWPEKPEHIRELEIGSLVLVDIAGEFSIQGIASLIPAHQKAKEPLVGLWYFRRDQLTLLEKGFETVSIWGLPVAPAI